MSEAKKMQLHLGKCIEDLDKLHSVPDLKSKRATVLVRTGVALAAQAEAARAAGDEERAYVYYMKYLRVVGALARHQDYRQHARYYTSMLGAAGPATALQRADCLKTSLIHRYQSEMSAQCSERPAEDVVAVGEEGEGAAPQEPGEDEPVISSERLHALLFGGDEDADVLVLDARPAQQWAMARVAHAAVVSVPQEVVVRGLSAGALRRALPPASRAAWEARAAARLIVLMDQCSAGDGTPPQPPHTLHTLATILLKWDSGAECGAVPRRVAVLRGGYADWALKYPWLTTAPAAPHLAPHSDTLADMLDEIEYPSWEDVVTGDEENVEGHGADSARVDKPKADEPKADELKAGESRAGEPRVDRSSKAAAAALYARTLARQQQLAEAALAAERARLTAEQDWRAVHTPGAPATDTLREQEILSQLLQLESKQHDMEQENQELRARLDEYRRKDEARLAHDTELTQRQAAIQEAAEQRAQLHERAQRLEQERVRRLEAERAPSPPLAAPPAPPAPVVDRATKPAAGAGAGAEVWERRLEGEPAARDEEVAPGHTGLRNLGNSCYLNACVQCLSHTPGLAAAFAAPHLHKHIDRGSEGESLAVELALVVRALWSRQWRHVSPVDLRRAVGAALPMFRGGGQHDCHELLTLLLDRLQQELRGGGVVRALFTGTTASTVRCTRCSHTSVSEETFTSLSLELPAEAGRCSLQECLRRHAAAETLGEWRCDKCRATAGATKRLSLVRAPRALVLHLKRFHMQAMEGEPRTVKRQTLVTFPLTGLDARLLGAREPTLYALYAVANHYGSSSSGHYTCVVRAHPHRQQPPPRWLMLDDHAVRPVPAEDVVSSAAYLLFYERLDDSAAH